MIRSMTGYGKAEMVVGATPCTIELRCVNGRFLEVSAKIPREFSDKEHRIREYIRSHVMRGSLTVTIRQSESEDSANVSINAPIAAAYVESLRDLQQKLGIGGIIGIEHLVQLPGVLSSPSTTDDDELTWSQIRNGLEKALNALNMMRDKEGADLAIDVEQRLAVIERGLSQIESTASLRIEHERTRLRERVAQILGEAGVDETRLALEIVLLSEKLDVAEECVRLRSHIKHMRQYISAQEHAGRKLNFLLQEMNREVNTIGSKSNNADVAIIVVEMKEELERMREQVQNVE
ncbi:MAG: hypothetical protein RIR53_1158 [Bacteroidota bacterium]|jgi:uncharacterized protein (TIGR00255 family)